MQRKGKLLLVRIEMRIGEGLAEGTLNKSGSRTSSGSGGNRGGIKRCPASLVWPRTEKARKTA